MNKFKYSNFNSNNLAFNSAHKFAMSYTMMIYKKNAVFSFIPKNACSTLRLSVAIENECINSVSDSNWIHANNQTFNATIPEVLKSEYSFVFLRCPYHRLASVFLDKFVSKKVDAWQYLTTLDRNVNLDNLTFREFVLSLKNNDVFTSNIHWKPQTAFLAFNHYDDYFSVENFEVAIKLLKEKIGFNIIDARNVTNHGTNKYEHLFDKCYADVESFDISVMRRNGKCPSHQSLYDEEIFNLVTKLYFNDIKLYKEKCNPKDLMIKGFYIPIDIYNVKLSDVKTNSDIDFLRDEAVRLESENLELSYKLMSLAYKARPGGEFIRKKYHEYKEMLNKGK